MLGSCTRKKEHHQPASPPRAVPAVLLNSDARTDSELSTILYSTNLCMIHEYYPVQIEGDAIKYDIIALLNLSAYSCGGITVGV